MSSRVSAIGAMKMEDSAMALNLPFSQLAAVILTCGLRPVVAGSPPFP
jgi:hypothetical protein